jgi:putative colanic acid biosynthesis UDP-glucose lipid carrier transferase
MIRQANTLLVVLVTCLLAYGIRFGYSALPAGYVVALLLALLLAAIVVPATGAYRREFEWAFGRKLRRLIAGWAIVVLMLVSLAAMLKVTDYYSRIWFGTWVLLCAVGLVAMLLISHAASVRSRKAGRNRRGIVLVGSGESARRVEAQIRSDPLSGLELLACFGEPWSESETRPLDQLAHFIDENRVQGVWIALPWEDKAILERALDMLKAVVVDVNVVPDLHQYRLLNQNISEWGGMPVISLSATPMTDAERRLKAVMDWLGALLLTLLLSPLLLLICLAILLSDGGPALYRQRRLGVGGESIDILKFRTMRSESAAAPFRQASPDDDRVTRVGRFLRRSSLDELPQIFNVLKGEMSLVGPRPHPVELNDEFKARIPKYMLRHKVKPGITGWAQVNGFRGQTDTPAKMALRIQHDLWYIQNWSLWLDLKILLMTPFVMMHRNAY